MTIEIEERTYDGPPQPSEELYLRCKQCRALDTLVENTMVPRSMGATLHRDPDGKFFVDFSTGDDNAFWEAENDHKWGCRSCMNEGPSIDDVFDIFDEEPS